MPTIESPQVRKTAPEGGIDRSFVQKLLLTPVSGGIDQINRITVKEKVGTDAHIDESIKIIKNPENKLKYSIPIQSDNLKHTGPNSLVGKIRDLPPEIKKRVSLHIEGGSALTYAIDGIREAEACGITLSLIDKGESPTSNTYSPKFLKDIIHLGLKNTFLKCIVIPKYVIEIVRKINAKMSQINTESQTGNRGKKIDTLIEEVTIAGKKISIDTYTAIMQILLPKNPLQSIPISIKSNDTL